MAATEASLLSQYSRAHWSSDDDQASLASVSAIAQTRDGYLWLGSENRLYRFDGIRFVPVDTELPPGAQIQALIGSRDGGLWVGSTNGLQFLKGSTWSRILGADGKALPYVSRIVEDHTGAIWASTSDNGDYGLVKIVSGKVSRFGKSAGVPNPVRALYISSVGRLWIGSDNGACWWNGTKIGECLKIAGQARALVEDAEHRLVVSDAAHGRILLVGETGTAMLMPSMSQSKVGANLLMKSRDSTLWVGTLGQGLIRLANRRVESYRRSDGLSGDLVNALFEDREGNVWVGTSNGLDRFRPPAYRRFTTKEGLSSDVITSIACSQNGGIWAGTGGGGLNRLDGNLIQRQKSLSPDTTVTALYTDRKGTLWVGTTNGLFYNPKSGFVSPFIHQTTQPRLNRVFTIVEAAGGIWFNDANRRLLRFDPISRELRNIAISNQRNDIYRLEPSRDGGLWVGFYHSGVGRVNGKDEYTPLDSGHVLQGPLRALYEDRDRTLWVGTQAGLYCYHEGVWRNWSTRQGIPEGGIQGIVGNTDGDLYLAASQAIFYLRDSTRRTLIAGSHLVPDGTISLDDLHVELDARSTGPRLALSFDGKLWIGSDQGIVGIPPPAEWPTKPRPNVVIESIIDNRHPVTPSAALSLKGSQVDFQYTALSLSNPKKILFRYLLEGFNKDWIEVGGQRLITFTNLSPGRYRFCVTAAVERGSWSTPPACQPFHVDPRFYQTYTFLGVVILTGISTLYGLYYLRLRNIRNRFALVLQERLRVARELHDTLLQGFAGISYQLEAAYRLIDTAPANSKARIERAMDQADEAMVQARQSISMLRLSVLDSGLATAISVAGERMTDGSGIQFKTISEGLFKDLPYSVEGTLYMMATEAIHNAVKHAAPRHIEIRLSRDAKGVYMAISDDGCGFDMAVDGTPKGHWGMRGMVERAKSIGVTLKIHSAPGDGTRVEVKIPVSLLAR